MFKNEVIEAFTNKFHNIQGVTVAERKRNFLLLLTEYNDVIQRDPEIIADITGKLSPSTHLETLFEVDFLIRFRNFEELWKRYKSGNDIVMAKVKRLHWFFENISKRLDELIFDVLPAVPVNVRTKILGRLHFESERIADETFQTFRRDYGETTALIILHECSCDLIRNWFRGGNSNLKLLTSKQLVTIFTKNTDLAELYLSVMNHDLVGGKVNFAIQFLTRKDPEKVCQFVTKFDYAIKFGKRRTKHLVAQRKCDIFESPNTFLKCLNPNSLRHSLKEDFPDLLGKLFPKDHSSFALTKDIDALLMKTYGRKTQFDILRKTFEKVYSYDLLDNFDLVTKPRILNLIKENQLRDKLAISKMEKLEINCDGEESYLRFCTPERCLKILNFSFQNRKFNITDFDILIQSCIRNQDLDTLLSILQYANDQYFNHNKIAAWKKLDKVLDRNRHRILSKFTEAHWDLVEKIAEATKNRAAVPSRCAIKKLLLFKFEQGVDVSKFGMIHKVSVFNEYDFRPRKQHKQYLLDLIKLHESDMNDDAETAYDSYLIFRACCIYNFGQKRAKDRIGEAMYKSHRILKSFKYIVSHVEMQGEYGCDHYLHWIICTMDHRTPELEEIQTLYFERTFQQVSDLRCIMWLLKYNPEDLKKHLEQFLTHRSGVYGPWFYDRRILWNFFKKYDHLDLPAEVIAHCSAKLGDRNAEVEEKVKQLTPLCVLMPPHEFFKLVDDYFEVGCDNCVSNDTREILREIGCLLQFVRPIYGDEEVLMGVVFELCHICDHLGNHRALQSLCSIVLRLPRHSARMLIDRLIQDDDGMLRNQGNSLQSVVR